VPDVSRQRGMSHQQGPKCLSIDISILDCRAPITQNSGASPHKNKDPMSMQSCALYIAKHVHFQSEPFEILNSKPLSSKLNNVVYVCTVYIRPYYVCIMHVCTTYMCMFVCSMLTVLGGSRGTTGRGENHAGQRVSVTPTATKRVNQLILQPS
jgi:hypothetical protein